MALLLGLGACAQRQVESGTDRLARGDAAGARASYEAAAASACAAGKTTPLCCQALEGKGDAQLAAGERDAARATYDEAITRCPRWARLRRQLFLARHPEAAQAVPAGESVDVALSVLLRPRLDQDLLLVWHAVTLDGLPLPLTTERRALAVKRVHEIESEADVRPFADASAPVTIVRTRHAFVIPEELRSQGPLAAPVTVTVQDKGPGAPAAARVGLQAVLGPLRTQAAIQRDEQAERSKREATVKNLVAPVVSRGLLLTPPRSSPDGSDPVHGSGWAVLKTCVNAAGQVTDVAVMLTSNAALTGPMVRAVYGWRYRPYQVDHRPVPFCTPVRFEVTFK
jgi:hypothetical protein